MRQLEYHGVDRFAVVERSEPPPPAPGWLTVRVALCGLCGSDLQKLKKVPPSPGYLATCVLGHEVVGTVSATGAGVARATGRRVAVQPFWGCASCAACAAGAPALCREGRSIGRDLPGGFAEYVSVPATAAFALRDEVPFADAVFADPLAVAVHAFHLAGPARRGGRCVVLGDGPLGLLCASLAGHRGFGRVVLVGKHRGSLAWAETRIGIEAVDVADLDAFCRAAGGEFDAVLECVGGSQARTLDAAVALARPAGRIVVTGVFSPDVRWSFAARAAFCKEIHLVGANSYGVSDGEPDFATALDLLRGGAVTLPPIARFALGRFVDAIESVSRKSTPEAKHVIECS